MNKEFIPYEQALELKELGFNERCYSHEEVPRLSDNKFIDRIPIPLYQQAFRWFRNEFGLRSWIEYEGGNYLYQIRPHKTTDYEQGEIYAYNVYEKTEKALLKKLIQIVKEKQYENRLSKKPK